MHGPVEITVRKEPSGLYRMRADAPCGECIAMAEAKPGGWHLTGHLQAGPYKTMKAARDVFTAFVQAGGGAAGLRAVRVLDRRVPLPASTRPDPMQAMIPGYDGPLDVAEVRNQAYIDPDGARALIDQHRQRLALYGEDPEWIGDRRRLLEQGYGDLIRLTKFERDEVMPLIRA